VTFYGQFGISSLVLINTTVEMTDVSTSIFNSV